MHFTEPTKGDDGLYFVKALAEDKKKKHFVQLNKATVASVTEGGEVALTLNTAANRKKIAAIDTCNTQAAEENSKSWFGKVLSAAVIQSAYTTSAPDDTVSVERSPPTRVFNADLESVDFSELQEGKLVNCIVEFAGLWFAKKAFGPLYNLVQVKMHADPVVSEYPEEYAFAEEDDDEEPEPEPVAEPEAQQPEAEVIQVDPAETEPIEADVQVEE